MALDFPNNPPPLSGDSYVAPNGQLYVYDGEKWIGSEVAQAAYTLPTASTSVLGGVKIDGTTITINNGVISGSANVDLTGYATETYVDNAFDALVDGAPGTLDTLYEIAATLKNDSGIIDSLLDSLSIKISHEDLSLSTGAATNGGDLTYDNTNGNFVFYPADLSDYVTTATLSDYATQSYVTIQGYITNSALSGYATETYVNSQGFITSSALSGYATETYVNSQGFITTGSLSVTTNSPGSQALTYNNGTFTFTPADLSSYATETYVTTQGYITSSALTGYATQTYVTTQGYITGINSSDVTTALGYTPIQLSSLSVTTTSASGGGSLSYNNTNGQFTFAPAVQYTLPTATTGVLGGVKVDGTTITIADGVISAAPAASVALSDLTDVNIVGTPTTGYVLKWNGTKWAPAVDVTAGGGGTDADTLDGQDGSYYLNYANFSGSPSLTVTTISASGGGSLSYSSGTFTFAPADLSSYATTSSLSNYVTNSSLSSTLSSYVTSTTLSGYNYIDLADLSVTTASASGSGSLSYNNANGVFTFTPPDLSSYLTGITGTQVTTALGYTPYNSSNPAGYTTNTGTVTSVSGTGTVSGLTLSGTVTTTGSLTLGGTLSLTSGDVTTALGYTPYNSTNPSNYITTGSLSVTSNTPSGTTSSLSYSNGVFTFTSAAAYSLPAATTTTLGGVIVPAVGTSGITNSSGTIGLASASTTQLGGVKIDGTTITLNGSNQIQTAFTMNQNVSSTSSVTFANVSVTGQLIEPFQTYSTAISGSPSITFNCANGNIWLVNPSGGPASAWTAAFTNVQITTGQATNITMIIVEGTTPFIPSAVSINGTSVTLTWQGGVAPTPTASKTEAIGYSVLQTGASTYTVLAQMVTFG